MLTWRNIAKAYGRRRLFTGLSGSLDAGDGLIVTGANGAGKSTLLKIIVGLVRPDSGNVEREFSLDSIGYSTPSQHYYPELTALENIRFAVEVRGIKAVDSNLQSIIESVGLIRSADKTVGTFSTGMLQRLRVACAMAVGHSLLVMDEPSIGLDSAGTELVEKLIIDTGELSSHRRCAIVATNDPLQVARLEAEGWGKLHVGS